MPIHSGLIAYVVYSHSARGDKTRRIDKPIGAIAGGTQGTQEPHANCCGWGLPGYSGAHPVVQQFYEGSTLGLAAHKYTAD